MFGKSYEKMRKIWGKIKKPQSYFGKIRNETLQKFENILKKLKNIMFLNFTSEPNLNNNLIWIWN